MRPLLDDEYYGYDLFPANRRPPRRPISQPPITDRKPLVPDQGPVGSPGHMGPMGGAGQTPPIYQSPDYDPTALPPPPPITGVPKITPQGGPRPRQEVPGVQLDTGNTVGNMVGQGFKAFADGLANSQMESPVDPNLGRNGTIFPVNRGPAMQPIAPVKPLFNPMGRRTAPSNFGGFLAKGGPVKPGMKYVVGEQGPEMLQIDKKGKGKVVPLSADTPVDPNSIPVGGGQMPSRIEGPTELGTGAQTGMQDSDDIAGIERQFEANKGSSETAPPKIDPDYYQHKYEGDKKALAARGVKAPSKGMSALSYVFQGMEHFANNMMGRANKPVVPLGDARYAREMENIDRKLQPIYEQKAIAEKQKFDRAKAEGELYESNKKQLQAIQQQNPDLLKTIWADQVIDDDDVEKARAAGFGELKKGDFRKFVNTESNGMGFSTPEIGAPNWQRNNLPTDPNKYQTPLTVLTEGGVPVATTGKDTLNRENAINVANTNYAGKTAEINRKVVDTDNKNAVEFKNQQTKGYADANQDADESVILFNKAGDATRLADEFEAKAKAIKQQASTNPLEALMADPAEVKALEKQAQEYREKAATWLAESKKKAASGVNKAKAVKDLMAPPATTQATPTKPLTAPKVVGQYAGFVFKSPEDLQSDFPGKTPAEIKAYIEERGGKFQK